VWDGHAPLSAYVFGRYTGIVGYLEAYSTSWKKHVLRPTPLTGGCFNAYYSLREGQKCFEAYSAHSRRNVSMTFASRGWYYSTPGGKN